MSKYSIPKLTKPTKVGKRQVLLVASGDMRMSANQTCWPKQKEMEDALNNAVVDAGYELVRAHPYKPDGQHGFSRSHKKDMAVFAEIDPKAKLSVAESTWQSSYNIMARLFSHQGPILTVANWSGTWPGLAGMLNLNACLTKAGKKYSTLRSEEFCDKMFVLALKKWLPKGKLKHK
jgi:hypothetical protein